MHSFSLYRRKDYLQYPQPLIEGPCMDLLQCFPFFAEIVTKCCRGSIGGSSKIGHFGLI